MAVSTEIAHDGPYLANGVTTSFPFQFSVMSAADVSVSIRDASGVEQTVPSFSVALTSLPPSTGTITFSSAPASGLEVIPYLDPPFTQDTQFADGSAWLAGPVNDANDMAALRDQVLRRDIGRALLVPVGVSGSVFEPGLFAGKVMGFSAGGDPVPVAVSGSSDPSLRADLAALTGSTLVNTATGETVEQRLTGLRSRILATVRSPYDFGAIGDGVANDQAAVQAAVDYCIAHSDEAVLDLTGEWNVDEIIVAGAHGLTVVGSCRFNAVATGAKNSMLSIKMPGVKWYASTTLNVGYRTNYACGLWVYATGTSGITTVQWSMLHNFTVDAALIGVRIGSAASPSALASELTLFGFSAYDCPVAAEVIGAQTYVTFTECQIIANVYNGDAAWQALDRRGLRCIGGSANIVGGQALLTASSDDALFELQPITGTAGEGTFYGAISVDAATVECSGKMLVTSNPSSLVIASTYNRRGAFLYSANQGAVTQNSSPVIETDAAYVGDVMLRNARHWFGPSSRSQPTVTAGSLNTHVYIDDAGMGDGFLPAQSGIVGGTLHFGYRSLLQVRGAGGQALAIGDNTIKFATLAGEDSARWEAGYNAATGRWTAAQGFGNLRVTAQVAFTAALTGKIKILDSGAANVRTVAFTSQTEVAIDWDATAYPVGGFIEIVVELTGAAGAVNSASAYLTKLTISGRN